MDDATTTATAPRQPLRPLRLLFWGLVMVVADVRINGLDLVPDPVGWLVALVAAVRLARWHRGFLLGAAGSVLGLVVSLPDWVGGGPGWVQPATTVAETAVVFGTCTALVALLPERRTSANLVRWWDLGLMLVAVLVVFPVAFDGEPPGLGAVGMALALALGLATVVVFVCFCVLVLRASGDSPEMGPKPA
jgi:hypothetical protein